MCLKRKQDKNQTNFLETLDSAAARGRTWLHAGGGSCTRAAVAARGRTHVHARARACTWAAATVIFASNTRACTHVHVRPKTGHYI